MDVFKKKENFDDLLKEPEGGSWDSNKMDNSFNDNSFNDNSFNGMNNPLASSENNSFNGMSNTHSEGLPNFGNDVMGLPDQNKGNDPFGSNNDVLSSNSTSASSLGLDTHYPSPPPKEYKQQYNYDSENNSNRDNKSFEQAPQHVSSNSRDVDLIISKLDLIKSTLQHLDSRISNIEQKLYEEKPNKW